MTDTIAAPATAPGRGALAVLRISGPATRAILEAVAPGWVERGRARTPTLVRITDPRDGRLLDRALVTYFPGPGSYTGEDAAEISTHGGFLVPSLVLDAVERAGARRAGPGEFTQRAYLNGKLDLVQAEGIRDLVDAGSEAFHRAALHQMEGGLSRRLVRIRERIVELEALLVHHLDFPEEDDPPVPRGRIVEAGRGVLRALEGLLETAPEGELLREGALAVLAGRPNSGKSSLFNALLGQERAIVTERPGTTRDALEVAVSLGGYPFRLVDTAGIRSDPEEVERLGIEVALRYLRGADAVLLCVSEAWGWGPEEERFLGELPGGLPVLVLRTKWDVREGAVPSTDDPARVGTPAEDARIRGTFPVSVVDGTGLARIGDALGELVFRGMIRAGWEVPVLTRRRQADGVETACREVAAFVAALEEGVPAEMASTHLRPAETALEELLGVISPEEILDRVFADFCIGK